MQSSQTKYQDLYFRVRKYFSTEKQTNPSPKVDPANLPQKPSNPSQKISNNLQKEQFMKIFDKDGKYQKYHLVTLKLSH